MHKGNVGNVLLKYFSWIFIFALSLQKVEWFKIEHLPAHKKDLTCKTHFGLPPNSFFMVIPFVKYVTFSLTIEIMSHLCFRGNVYL